MPVCADPTIAITTTTSRLWSKAERLLKVCVLRALGGCIVVLASTPQTSAGLRAGSEALGRLSLLSGYFGGIR